jgi:6-pyruvoyltetrahydropterin/6-carboxytetrahydropterin synthase
MFELKISSHFAAAHQLKMVAKKCENLHGHNWKIEVCVVGDKLNHAGVLVDFGIIKKHLREIVEKLDHRFLNDLEPFNKESHPPSSENIASHIAYRLQECLSDSLIRVSRVTAWESDDACATYILPASP